MGILIGADSVSHEWPGKRVLVEQTLGVYEGDRIGVVGRNGDGKSSLLELLAHEVEPDSGTITWRNGISVGLLGQDDDLRDEDTAIRAVVGDTPEYEWAGDPTVRSILGELLRDIPYDKPVGELSGGQRRRVDLARLLATRWDVLLLDEPTNHLDVRAITWLASHLKNRWPEREGALLVVTHDRWFLDEVCQAMWEVHDGQVEPFEGGFSAYIQQRVERERQAQVAETRRQNMLRRELAWLSRGAQARTSKPKFRIAEAQALIADVPPLRNPIELKRLSVARLGKQVIEMDHVSAGYGDVPVVQDVGWLVGPGERIGILGVNGAGKSTLLRVMDGRQKPSSGTVRIGKSVRFGRLSQRLDELSERDDWRVRDLLNQYRRTVTIEGKEYTSEKLLERLGFDSREFMTPVGDLSGGQRRRLAIMCLLLEEPNVLVLDEPGNDLDTDMLAVLEDLLDSWPGTLILVTHDRYLMERVVDDQYALVDGHVRHLPGGVDEYLRILAEREEEQAAEEGGAASPEPQAAEEHPASGLSNQERRAAKKRFDSLGRRLEKASAAPDEARARLAAADPTNYEELQRLQAEVDAAEAELAALEDEWLELSELLGE